MQTSLMDGARGGPEGAGRLVVFAAAETPHGAPAVEAGGEGPDGTADPAELLDTPPLESKYCTATLANSN